MRPAQLVIASILIALAGSNACAQWKWRDASGQITASDLPPPASVREQDILARPVDTRRAYPTAAGPAASAIIGSAPVSKPGVDPELEARRKRAADELAAQQRQLDERNAAGRADSCNRARGNLAALSDGRRVNRTNAQGELEPIDDKLRAEELQRARNTIASDCK